VDFNEAIAKAMGFKTRRLPIPGRADNLLVTLEVGAGKPWLMFESHMDTVAVDGMTIDPFAGEVRDGRLWGRGSCDTKGTGAAMLWAMRRYAQGGVTPNNIALLFAIDEEFGMTGVRAYIGKHRAQLGFDPIGVIVGEPTMLAPITAHNGCVRWIIRTRGVAAHSANPAKGRSAISAMMRVVDAVESRYVPSLTTHHPMTGKAQCSINMIQGGNQINIIPELCEVRVDRRVVPGEDPATVLPAVQAVLDAAGLRGVEQELIFQCPPLCPEHSERLVKPMEGVLAGLGLPTESRGVPYATDAGDLGVAGIPTLVIGPGDIAQAHTKDEFLALDQLHKGVEVYEAMMRAAW
jgi:acetylornithine deacetylase